VVTLRDANAPAEYLDVVLGDGIDHGSVRLRIPNRGGHPEESLPRGNLELTLVEADEPSTCIVSAEPSEQRGWLGSPWAPWVALPFLLAIVYAALTWR
jgi:hypothetical protein